MRLAMLLAMALGVGGCVFSECLKGADCPSGLCIHTVDRGYRCVRRALPGAACTRADDCRSQGCVDGGCACVVTGLACDSDAECCSGLCDGALRDGGVGPLTGAFCAQPDAGP